MSLWIRQKKGRQRLLWLIDVHRILLLVLIGAGGIVPLFLKGASAVFLIAMVAGAAFLAAAKISLFRRGIWISWGPEPMTRTNARLYWIGYASIGCGTALLCMTLLSTFQS
jgi:hypothetical protein